MQITISKSPIPILWLDTSVIIWLTKYRVNENLSELEYKRFSELYKIINTKVNAGKLLCPKADQLEEIELGQRLVEDCEKTSTLLSLGIRFVHRGQIESIQRQQFMKAYINGESKVNLDYKDAFYSDPVKEIRRQYPFIISAWAPTSIEQIQKNDQAKRIITEKLEKARRDCLSRGISFEEQLNIEYKGIILAYLNVLEELQKIILSGREPTVEEIMKIDIISKPMDEWVFFRGKNGYIGLLQFYTSDVYKMIPNIDISCRLLASLVTSKSPIKSGDTMDIEQLSSIIPYCNYVITDRSMRNRLINLGIDQKYNTTIWCMHNYDSIICTLEKLYVNAGLFLTESPVKN